MNKEELEKKIIEYRENHPRCSWCVFYDYHSRCFGEFTWHDCFLKQDTINMNFEKIKARFCKQYCIDEEKIKNEISTIKENES